MTANPARKPSLLEQGITEETERERLQAADAEPRLRAALESAYSAFLDGERSSDAREILFRQMAKAAENFPIPDGYGRRRQALLGAYFEAAMRVQRPAGRPRVVDPHMLVFVWMQLRDAGKVKVGPFDPGARAPVAAIAAECQRQGHEDVTAERARKAIAGIRLASTRDAT